MSLAKVLAELPVEHGLKRSLRTGAELPLDVLLGELDWCIAGEYMFGRLVRFRLACTHFDGIMDCSS